MSAFQGVRTRVMLVAAIVLVTGAITGGSLLIVRDRIRRQANENLSADLTQSLLTFQNLQRQRRSALIHEDALLADLPSLKALMTTEDQRTITDGALEFWRVSSSDLFALVDNSGHVVALDTAGPPPSPALRAALQSLLLTPQAHYLVADGRMFDFAVQPLFFGRDTGGTLLGYVISGYAMDRSFLNLISQSSAVEAAFLTGSRALTSTLPAGHAQQDLLDRQAAIARDSVSGLVLGGEDYLATSVDLGRAAAVPLRLVVLKSFARAHRAVAAINRLVALLGFAALLLGTLLMLALSRVLTRPLEQLADGVRAFGCGDPDHALPTIGTLEVRELSAAFGRMRTESQQAGHALLEAERLATIGRMASSVSHDLRHYLAAVYANAEFLSSPRLSAGERSELFQEISVAVLGTTELIDSLLIFSKGGRGLERSRESVAALVDKAAAILGAHPEAEGVTIQIECREPAATITLVDAKKLERAIYNLLLNGCQSARRMASVREVRARISAEGDTIRITVIDSGAGVPEQIRESLFEPFVSDGKQSGTGLGLTLAHAIAVEHGGAVRLLHSRPGETVFELSLLKSAETARPALARATESGPGVAAGQPAPVIEEAAREKRNTQAWTEEGSER